MLKRITTLVLLAGFLALPAIAAADNGGKGGGGGGVSFGTLRVHNAVDEAIEFRFGENVSGVVLEPQETRSFTIFAGSKPTEVLLAAHLVSNPDVSSTATVTVQKNKTTNVRVTSNASGTELSITEVKGAKANN